jgi:3-methyladenine DNA glycosylase AlkD
MPSGTVSALRAELRKAGSSKKAAASAWFFKTGKGEYAEGDRFIGVTVPEQRAIAKRYRHLPLSTLEALLHSAWHEERLIALFLLVNAFETGDVAMRKRVYTIYCRNTRFVNNWDLVDSSAEYIVGPFLDGRSTAVLTRFAKSKLLWERRIAIVATHHWIRRGSSKEALRIAAILVHDKHDLIQKAVGWMLREVGVYCSRAEEEVFLQKYAATMPRTMLRYALEHFPASRRIYYLKQKK